MPVTAHDVTAADGTRLCLWEQSADDPERAVLFVHGATYAIRSIFAPEGAPAHSWFGTVADAGGAAFGVDIRGYGDSERPPAMDAEDPAELPSRAPAAATDVRAALDAVHERVDGPVHLVGTSWGTIVCGTLLTAADAPDVASVTFHAPMYEPDPAEYGGFDPDRAAPTRELTRERALERWNEQIPRSVPATLRDGDGDDDPVFEAFWAELLRSGQASADGNTIVAPNGTLADLAAATEGSLYDPSAIDVPTLVVRGTLDPTSTRADATALYDALDVPGDEAAYAEIEGGTHFVHVERRCRALYDTVRAFQTRVEP